MKAIQITEPGWYWYRHNSCRFVADLRVIEAMRDHRGIMRLIESEYSDDPTDEPHWEDGEFFGPIAPPPQAARNLE